MHFGPLLLVPFEAARTGRGRTGMRRITSSLDDQRCATCVATGPRDGEAEQRRKQREKKRERHHAGVIHRASRLRGSALNNQ